MYFDYFFCQSIKNEVEFADPRKVLKFNGNQFSPETARFLGSDNFLLWESKNILCKKSISQYNETHLKNGAVRIQSNFQTKYFLYGYCKTTTLAF